MFFYFYFFFFFFQEEDGIRDYKVTEVQTCAPSDLRIALTRELKALELDVDCKDLHLACKDIILFQ